MPRISKHAFHSHWGRNWRHGLFIALLATVVAACGGGGGDSNDNGGTSGGGTDGGSVTGGGGGAPVSADRILLEAEQDETAAGGEAITLTVRGLSAANAVTWVLVEGSPGTLSETSGHSVDYIPPPAGTAVINNTAKIVASSDGATDTIDITVSDTPIDGEGTTGAAMITPLPPDDDTAPGDVPPPAAPGIYLLAGNDFGAGMADGTGTSARFDTPWGIARDADGTLYVADRANNVIRKISATGTVSTLAGLPGANGIVDGQGSAARFSAPAGIAIDAAGNLYVTDASTIRKITPDGVVTTVAGNPELSGYRDGSGAEALFGGNVTGITVDAQGNIYVCDTSTVRKITPEGEVTTFAGQHGSPGAQDGTGTAARFIGLKDIAADAVGNLYVVDGDFWNGPMLSDTFYVSASIRKITTDGTVSTLAGTGGDAGFEQVLGHVDGAGTEARFRYPYGIVVDESGNLFVSDRGNKVIRRVTPDGTVTTVAGTAGQGGSTDGAIESALFMYPTSIAMDPGGTLYVTDSAYHTVRAVVPGDSVTTLAGAAPKVGSADGTRSVATFNAPRGITRDADGNLYVADTGNHTIRRIATDGTVTTLAGTAGETGAANGVGAAARFYRPRDVAANATGTLFVSDFSNRLIRSITPAGVVSTYAGTPGSSGYEDGPAASARFVEPQAVAVDIDGDLYVVDRAGDTVRRITPEGMVSTFAGTNDSNGSTDGIGSAARFSFPQDIAVDSSGNAYVIDSGTAIRKITPDAMVSTLAGAPFSTGIQDGTGANARFNAPQSVAVDADGNVYVADSRAIRRITPQGVVTTVAGVTPDGQAAELRNIHRPSGLVMTGPKTLAFTAGDGVFELRLP